jgi:transcriptional regulator with XRE-family HTH domain
MESATASPAHDGKLTLNPARLKSLRRAWGMSQESLAQLCVDKHLSISIASIKRAEAGKPVLYRTARHLAQLYQVELASLVLAPPAAPEPPLPLLGMELRRPGAGAHAMARSAECT